MPVFQKQVQPFKAPKGIEIDWDNFRGGLNTLLRPQELKKDELAQADNLMLVGSGVPTKRWGSANYHMAGAATGSVRGITPYYNGDTNELLAVTDWGYMTKKSSASYAVITGASWASGYNAEMVQLDNNVYVVNGQREMVRYNGSDLVGYATLATPSGLTATNFSGATGKSTWSWRISAESQVGETLASTAVSLASLPQSLTDTLIYVNWSAVSAASGVLKGYNVYRGIPGDETLVSFVGPDVLRYDDHGQPSSILTTTPTADTTGGPNAKYIIRHKDRLIVAGLDGEPTKVMISGRIPNHERFHWSVGGGFVNVEPDTGDDITGLAIHQEKIIVFKENSIWQIKLESIEVGNFSILDPQYQLITASQGCSSHRSIVPVENDLLFCGRKGVYVLGNEPGILGDVLRTNELSVKVRPFIRGLTQSHLQNAAAAYIDNKYILSFPGKGQTLCFDRERNCFMGPWSISFDPRNWIKYVESGGSEVWLAADGTDTYVSQFSDTLYDDKGSTITTFLRTKKEDFGNWTIFKNIENVFSTFRNVLGTFSVNIRLERRDGETTTAKSFSVSAAAGAAGWGTDAWGLAMWCDTNNVGGTAEANELVRQARLNKSARSMQLEVQTSNRNDKYELFGFHIEAKPQSKGFRPSSWRIAGVPPIGMIGEMTGNTPSNQIFLNIVEWIRVNMMDMQFIFGVTFLALVIISLFYFFSKRSSKTSFISNSISMIPMNVGRITFTNSLFSKFLFSRFRKFSTKRSMITSTITRAISTSTLSNPVGLYQHFFPTIKTIFLNRFFPTPMSRTFLYPSSPKSNVTTFFRTVFTPTISYMTWVRIKRFITDLTSIDWHRNGIVPTSLFKTQMNKRKEVI